MALSGWKTANNRQTAITSWFIAISAVLLVLYLTEPKPDSDKEWFDYYFEAVVVILLIISLLLYLLSATYLIQPFYQDDEPTTDQLKRSAVFTRRVQIPGAFTIFWAIGFLILLKLEYSNAVLAYSIVAFVAPVVWLGFRRIAKMQI
jgi:hypothetical protein